MKTRIVVPDDAPVVLGTSRAFAAIPNREEIEYYDTLPQSEEELLARIGGAEVVINIRSSVRFTAEVFRRSAALRLLSIWGTGTDNVDLAAAAKAGVTVTNTPGVAAPSIAEHALALLFAVARNLVHADASMRRGEWSRGGMTQLQGKTLGVIGLGAIGRRFAALGAGIGMRVIAWTMHPNPSLGYELVTWDELFSSSDVISLHLRLSPDTDQLIGARECALMRPGAIFVNTARGRIVDEAALLDALSSHRIAGAGLDVYSVEPLPSGHPLTRLPNVVLTPHCAGITPETLEAGLALALRNVQDYLAGQPAHVVAAPANG